MTALQPVEIQPFVPSPLPALGKTMGQEMRRLREVIDSIRRACPQVSTKAPVSPGPGMLRWAETPWFPAPGQAEAAWVQADAAGTWNYPAAKRLSAYTVANLPAGGQAGALAFATNGLKPGQATGAGTGVPVFFDGSAWFSMCSGTTVSA